MPLRPALSAPTPIPAWRSGRCGRARCRTANLRVKPEIGDQLPRAPKPADVADRGPARAGGASPSSAHQASTPHRAPRRQQPRQRARVKQGRSSRAPGGSPCHQDSRPRLGARAARGSSRSPTRRRSPPTPPDPHAPTGLADAAGFLRPPAAVPHCRGRPSVETLRGPSALRHPRLQHVPGDAVRACGAAERRRHHRFGSAPAGAADRGACGHRPPTETARLVAHGGFVGDRRHPVAGNQSRYPSAVCDEGAVRRLAGRNPDGVVAFRDFPDPMSTFQGHAGVYTRGATVADDRPKPALASYAFPFLVVRERSRTRLWGLAPRAGATVQVQQSVRGHWRRLATLRSRGRVFTSTRVRVRPGRLVRARAAGRVSPAWRAP
jgi:hypothetical protein